MSREMLNIPVVLEKYDSALMGYENLNIFIEQWFWTLDVNILRDEISKKIWLFLNMKKEKVSILHRKKHKTGFQCSLKATSQDEDAIRGVPTFKIDMRALSEVLEVDRDEYIKRCILQYIDTHMVYVMAKGCRIGIRIEDILMAQSELKYTTFFTKCGTFLSECSVISLERREYTFFASPRRGCLVSTQYIQYIYNEDKIWRMVLVDEKHMVIARRKVAGVLQCAEENKIKVMEKK